MKKNWWKFSMILFCGVQWWRLCWEQCSVAQKRDPSGQIKFSRVSLVLPVRLPFWGEWPDRNFPRQIFRESPSVFWTRETKMPAPRNAPTVFFNEMLSPPPLKLSISKALSILHQLSATEKQHLFEDAALHRLLCYTIFIIQGCFISMLTDAKYPF